MANNTLSALNSLAEQVPGLNQKALSQVQAARDIGLQRQLQAAPQRSGTAPAAGLATKQALQAGQDIVAQRQQAAATAQGIRAATLQERGRVGQQAQQEAQLAQQAQLERQRTQQLQELRDEELQSRKTILDTEVDSAARLQELGIDQDNRLQLATIKQREDLSRIGLDVKGKLIDSRLQFKKDERGRKFTNERQLSDFVAATAENKQQFNARLSQMKNEHDKKMLLLKQSAAQIELALERGFINEQDDLDFESKKRLGQMQAAMREKINDEAAAARNRQAQWQAGGTIVGAGAGAVLGSVIPGAGTAAGAALGGAVGGAVGSIAGSAF